MSINFNYVNDHKRRVPLSFKDHSIYIDNI